jgi:hypothetical protein
MKSISLAVAAVAAAAALAVLPAEASSPPVGQLPKGPVASVVTHPGQYVAVALPHRSNGLVWRLARPLDPKVLRQVSEADVGSTVVVVFRAVGRGKAAIRFGLTRGETARAYASHTSNVRVG